MIPLGVLASARVVAAGGTGYAYAGTIYSGAGSTTRTFAAQGIGTAASNRTVIVSAHSRGAGGRPATAVTVGGVSATKHVELVDGAVSVQIWTAVVPTGTTADIVLSYGALSEAHAVGVWVAYGTLAYSASGTSGDAGSSVTLSAPSACLTIAAQTCVSGAGIGTAYTGATDRYRSSTADYMTRAGADAQPSAGSHAVAVTSSSGSNSAAVVVDFTLT